MSANHYFQNVSNTTIAEHYQASFQISTICYQKLLFIFYTSFIIKENAYFCYSLSCSVLRQKTLASSLPNDTE